jgi:preprotein translocase subunit SecG
VQPKSLPAELAREEIPVFVIFVSVIHVILCLFLVLVVLLQQGKGGGMSAFGGGGAATQVFGGGGAGNLLTRATAVCATLFMVTSIVLARKSSEKDLGLREFVAAKERKDKERGTPRQDKVETPAIAPSSSK